VGAITSIAIVITLGLVALAPLGAATAGVAAAFLTVIVGAAVYALLGRSTMPVGGPTSATVVIVAAMLVPLASSPALPPGPAGLAAVLVALGLAVVGMGLLQVLMAWARLGRLARFVPQPVLSGFMSGVALLIVLAQLPPLLALEPDRWASEGVQALARAQPGALVLGLATTAVIVWLARVRGRWPGALIGLGLATLVWHGVAAVWPQAGLGVTLAPVTLPSTWPGPVAALQGDASVLALVKAHPATLLLGAVVLALVGGLESLLNLRAVDQQVQGRHDENRELLALGVANLFGGLLGALPTVMLRARATAILQAGGVGGAAALSAAAASLLLLAAAGTLLALLPKAALAGVMLVVAASLVDGWSRTMLRQCRNRQRRAALAPAMLTTALVAVATVVQGPAAGVAVGIAVAGVVFVRRIRGQTLRWRGTAEARPSRRVYPPPLELALSSLRPRIAVLELQGALFWGNAERVAEEAEALPTGGRFVVLDLRRVSAVDESAAVELLRLDQRLAERGVTLLPAGPPCPATEGRPWGDHLAQAGGGRPLACWPDADRAVEHAERVLLAEQGVAPDLLVQPIAPEDTVLPRGLDPRHQQAVLGRLQPRRLSAGEHLFREGDPADAVYLLTRGSITVVAQGTTRYASFSPGTLLGELAALDSGGRSADAVADRASEVLVLPTVALAQLDRDDPTLAALLYRQIATHLADRLRRASAAWTDAAA
jgi:MFS superfamily sulfate permease-like transporter